MEKKRKKDHFTTGEFAAICGVNKQTLFHYDKEGIFSPDVVGDNGYRYYSYTQIESFTVIATLRDLGVSIGEIKRHLDRRSPHALIDLLAARKAEISQKIRALQWSARYIDNKIRLTCEGMEAEPGVIIIRDFPPRSLITSDYKGPDDAVAITEAIGGHVDYCARLGLYSACPIGCIIPLSSVGPDGFSYSKFYTVVENDAQSSGGAPSSALDAGVRPGGPHLVLYDDHGYENVDANCLRLIDYAAKNDLTLGEEIFEDVILDDLATDGYYSYLVKLSVQIL